MSNFKEILNNELLALKDEFKNLWKKQEKKDREITPFEWFWTLLIGFLPFIGVLLIIYYWLYSDNTPKVKKVFSKAYSFFLLFFYIFSFIF